MRLKKYWQNQQGFTLIEAMVAISILAVGILGTVTLQGEFAKHTTQREVLNCSVDAASSAMHLCRQGLPIDPIHQCDNFTTASLVISQGTCTPDENQCSTVNIIATATGRNVTQEFHLTSLVCNFTDD